jgi:lipopolysaccharide cholinephosphotransferase
MDFDKLFPDNREQGETLLRQCQLVMLRMLKILDYLCTKYKVEYFLSGGTLLGAIRHKGFIPWDDDLDIGMTRVNYEKFLQFAVAELPNDIFFQNTETDPSYPSCVSAEARLRDKYSSYSHIDKPNNKWHEGLQVDIFVYDKAFLPHNFFIAIPNAFFHKIIKNSKTRAMVLKLVAKKAPLPLVYASNFLSGFKAIKWGANYIKPNEISTLIRVPFEDMEAYIPVGWDACLKRQYGDYMQLPPIEKRTSHHKVIADPFHACEHTETLHWENRGVQATS